MGGEMSETWAMLLAAVAVTIGLAVGQLSAWERIRRRYFIPRDISVEGWLDLQELRLKSAEACLEMYALEIRSLQKEPTDVQ